MNTVTQIIPEFFLHLQPQGALLVEKRSMYYFRLSGEAVEIALLLARNKSIKKTAKILSLTKGIEITEKDLLNKLTSHPLTETWKYGIDEKFPIYGSTNSYIPISCTLQLTNACNLNCSFCYASSGKRLNNELTTEEWINVFIKLSSSGVSDVTLTGGEAKLIEDFKQIITAASSLFTNVHLFSNGLNWKEDEIELVKNLGNIVVQVSVDGTADIHDYLRGKKGAYQETFKNIKKITSENIDCLIAMTVNSENYHSVEEVIKDSVRNGAKIFRAGITLPIGRAKNISYGLTNEQFVYVNEQLKNAAGLYSDRIYISPWEDENNGCTDFSTPGYLHWYIRADGIITPCQVESVSLGHILHDSIFEIGNPNRLDRVKKEAKSCKCIKKVELPKEIDLPFNYEKN
jgi:sporulation killing factor system radical SAM maturase